jgi:hypothetical protein
MSGIFALDWKVITKGHSIFIFLLVVSGSCFSQIKPYNSAVIWRGFKHQWTYNHRCHRIGDYVVYNQGKPESTHTSSTGLGADSTYFSSYYTFITSPGLFFKEGSIKLKIESKEKQLNQNSVEVAVKADTFLAHKNAYVAFLNGFDLKSEEAADKVQLLRLGLGDAKYDTANNEVKFMVNYSLVLNCQSIECPEFNNRVDYDLDVYYLLIGIDDSFGQVSQQVLSRGYPWD